MDMNAINASVDERVITRHLVSRPPSGPPPTHLYVDPGLVPRPPSGPPPTDLYGGPANVLGANVNGHLLEDPAPPSSATAAVERPPPIEERREDENGATSTENAYRGEAEDEEGCRPFSMIKPWRQKPEKLDLPLSSRVSRGKSPRKPWRKRGGVKRKADPRYDLAMAEIARTKGKGKGGSAEDARHK